MMTSEKCADVANVAESNESNESNPNPIPNDDDGIANVDVVIDVDKE